MTALITKYQRFVAWRYLLERERELSTSILAFVGICCWVALGMGAACLWYPLADSYVLPPPNPPLALIAMVGLSATLPLLSLLAAVVSVLRRRNPLVHLVRGLHWSLLAMGVFWVFETSREPGFSAHQVAAAWVAFWILGFGIFVATKKIGRLRASHQQETYGLLVAFSSGLFLVGPLLRGVGAILWLLWSPLRLLLPASLRKFALPFLAAMVVGLCEVFLVAGGYLGLRASLWADLFPASGVLVLFAKVALVATLVFAVILALLVSSARHRMRNSLALNLALAALLIALTAAIGNRFASGVSEVSLNLAFLGGWQAYTPPMGLVMPALGAAAIGLLAFVLLWVRYFFTFFTTVSVGGVTIGTMALIIVLSVMSGFEGDLREKILGFNAHIQISRTDELQFSGYREVEAVLEKTAGIVGYTPFLTTEAYMSNNNNYANVTLKGIDPGRIASVTEIVHNLEEGDERALEKIWPLDEDGSILGKPEEQAAADDDFELDDAPFDFSGGLETIEEDEPSSPQHASRTLDAGITGEPGEPGDPGLGDPGHLGDAGLGDLEDAVASHGGVWNVAPGPGPFGFEAIDPDIATLDGVLVGRELVKTINLYTGQEVRVISPLPDTSPVGLSIPRLKSFRVAGRFFSGMYEYDLKYVYCSLDALQSFLDLDDVVNGIEIRVKNPQQTAPIVNSLEKSLGPGYRVQDWKDLNRALFSALKLEKIAMFFILVIIVLVASFSIVGNLIMVVIEKAKEIAILKTLGASNGGVMKIFITQGFFIGLVGTSLGVFLGLGACYLGITFGVPLDPDVYYIDKLPIQVEGFSVLAIAASGLAISVVATIYPAFVAARMRPVKGLRWD